jgi:hypothetical protein
MARETSFRLFRNLVRTVGYSFSPVPEPATWSLQTAALSEVRQYAAALNRSVELQRFPAKTQKTQRNKEGIERAGIPLSFLASFAPWQETLFIPQIDVHALERTNLPDQ